MHFCFYRTTVVKLAKRGFIAVIGLTWLLTAHADNDKILSQLKKARPDFNFEAISETPVKGIYRTGIVGGPTIYITEDGKYFFSGDFFEVGKTDIINLAEKALEKDREAELAKLNTDDMIVFSPEGKLKKFIYVFTDVDCYYCQKLHAEIAEINALGIEVRYLAFPRAGIGSQSYRKIASAWCADKPREALTAMKAGQTVADNVCDPNPIAAQYELGGRLGVRGTPAIITESGRLMPGYLPAQRLAKELALQ